MAAATWTAKTQPAHKRQGKGILIVWLLRYRHMQNTKNKQKNLLSFPSFTDKSVHLYAYKLESLNLSAQLPPKNLSCHRDGGISE